MYTEVIKLWKNREDVTVTSYCMDKNNEIIGCDRRPAVIVSPGGGYAGFTEREGESAALRFVAAGYQAFVLHYSVCEKAAFPNALYDLAQTMCYLHQNAKKLCIDENKIVVCGFSAGGNVSASRGVMWNQEFVREKFQVPAEWLKPAAMILGYAVLNFGFTSRGPLSGEQEEMMQNCNRYITGKEQPEKEDFDKINLLRFVSEDTPPAFLFHLCADPIVPVDNTLQFASRLAAFDIPFALEIGEDAWHGVSSLKAEDANIGFFKSEYAGWFDRAICWLKKKLFVENA